MILPNSIKSPEFQTAKRWHDYRKQQAKRIPNPEGVILWYRAFMVGSFRACAPGPLSHRSFLAGQKRTHERMMPRRGWSMTIDQMSEPRQRTGGRAGPLCTAFRCIWSTNIRCEIPCLAGSNLLEDSQFAEARANDGAAVIRLACALASLIHWYFLTDQGLWFPFKLNSWCGESQPR